MHKIEVSLYLVLREEEEKDVAYSHIFNAKNLLSKAQCIQGRTFFI